MKKVKIKTAFLSLHTLLQSVFKSKYEQKVLATLTTNNKRPKTYLFPSVFIYQIKMQV